MKWDEALKKYRHKLGEPCPMTGKPFENTFTDHSRGGYGDDGLFHIVSFNSCANCHDDQRTIGERVHDIAKTRMLLAKKEEK